MIPAEIKNALADETVLEDFLEASRIFCSRVCAGFFSSFSFFVFIVFEFLEPLGTVPFGSFLTFGAIGDGSVWHHFFLVCYLYLYSFFNFTAADAALYRVYLLILIFVLVKDMKSFYQSARKNANC